MSTRTVERLERNASTGFRNRFMILFFLSQACIANTNLVILERTKANTLTIETSIGPMLFDTGSSSVLLTKETKQKAITGPSTPVAIKLANGRTYTATRFVIKELSIRNCVFKDIEGYSLDTDKNILGMSVIDKMSNVSINLKTNHVHFDCAKPVYKIYCRRCIKK